MNPHPRHGAAPPERSLGDLVKELAAESSELVRKEAQLARTELRQSVRAAGRDLGRIAIGVTVAAVGGLTLVAFLVAALGELLGDRYWLSTLIVGGLLAAIGGWLAYRAVVDLRKVQMKPQATLSSLLATQQWAGEQAAEMRAALTGNVSADGRQGLGHTPGGRLAAAGPATASAGGAAGVNRTQGARAAAAPAAGSGSEQHAPERDRGKKEGLLKAVMHEFSDDDLTGQAAKLAYYAFMAMPPALMALFALAGLFGGPELARWIEQQASMALPATVTDSIVRPFIEQVVLNNAPGPFSIGLLLALWGASSVFAGLMDTLNRAYDVEETRSFVKKRAVAMGVMVVGVLLFLIAAVALLAGPGIPEALGLGRVGELVWQIVHWPLAFAFVVAAFWIGYYVLPNRDQSGCKKVLLKAAAAAALLWLVATTAFRFYISNFSSYSETYGFLGAFIVLLLWLYVTGLVVLTGGELASEMEERA